jgi:hypothetical protein
MNFDTNAKTTDIIMFNSRNLGALIVDERPHVKEWDEPQFGIQNIWYRGKLRFRRAQRRSGHRCRQERPRPRQRVQPGRLRSRQRRLRERELRGAKRSRRREPINVNAERFDGFLLPGASLRVRLGEFRDRCRAGPGAGLGNPRWTRVFLASGAGPRVKVLEPKPASQRIASSGGCT